MVQVLERPEVKEHEGDTLLREAPPREIPSHEVPRVRYEVHRPKQELTPAPKRPIRWMRWLLVGLVLVFAAGALFVVFNDNGPKTTTPTTTPAPVATRDYRTADGWERYYLSQMGPAVVTRDYRTADSWERYLGTVSLGTLDYGTADGYERALATVEPVMGDHRTADGWERYLDHLTELRTELLDKW